MGLGFFNNDGFKPGTSPQVKITIDLLFPTEMYAPEYKGKKRDLLDLIKKWKQNGTEIPLFYHPHLHLIVVRLDDSVSAKKAKRFFEQVQKLDYEFEVYFKTKEVLDIEF